MDELFNLNYKDEVDALKALPDYEAQGDARYIHHSDTEARLYWAFCRPSGSHPSQIEDEDPLVSIMAFNHSRLSALERFVRLHPRVIQEDVLRIKIAKRTRMLFRDLLDHDFSELNLVLEKVPVFLDVAIEQLFNGRLWNDVCADAVQATLFLARVKDDEEAVFETLCERKFHVFDEEWDTHRLQAFLQNMITQKENVDVRIRRYYQEAIFEWTQKSNLHLLQKKGLEKLAYALL